MASSSYLTAADSVGESTEIMINVDPREVSVKNCSNANQNIEMLDQDDTGITLEIPRDDVAHSTRVCGRIEGNSLFITLPPAPSAASDLIPRPSSHSGFQNVRHASLQLPQQLPPSISQKRLLFIPDPSRKLARGKDIYFDLGWTHCSVPQDVLRSLPPEFKDSYWHHVIGRNNDAATAEMRDSSRTWKSVLMSEWVCDSVNLHR